MKTILYADEIKEIIKLLSKRIIKKYKDLSKVALVGIHTNGIYLANRLKEQIKLISKHELNIGTIDITFYRDDIGFSGNIGIAKETKIDFDINDIDIILVDDVIHTGRTIRAAIDQILEIGRPSSISVLALIDRNMREIPIYAEFVGKKVKISNYERIEVILKETGKKDIVLLYDKKIKK